MARMTRMRRPFAIALPALAVTALLLSACSSASTADGSGATAAASSPSASSAASSAEASAPSTPTAGSDSDAPTSAAPASTCDASATLVEMTEGPYYTPNPPERATISDADTVGIPLVITGVVYDADCQPVAGATLDFWQADGSGTYDNEGYNLRGVQTTDEQGAYTLTTVIPGLYPSRTEHVHVKVTAPGGPTYTTQLYFPDVPQNDSDGIFDEAMLVTVTAQDDDSMDASFDFVLP